MIGRVVRVTHPLQVRARALHYVIRSSKLPSPAETIYPNQYFRDDPEGTKVCELGFVEEALGMPAPDGYGWAQLEFGERVGPNNRYTIARKLGWGMGSSTWLARDERDGGFVAVKALTGYHTDLYEKAVTWEADAFRLLSYQPRSPHCTPLLNEFTVEGKGSSGSHMCFVMPVYGGDVKALQRSRPAHFPLPLAKRISLHLLRGLAHMHERGVVHTDLKHDNIFYTTTKTSEDIEEWMANDPPRRNEPEFSDDGVMQSAVSQPLPIISEEEVLQATYVLGDFGVAHPSKLHPNREVSPVALRSPEVYLGAGWDKPTDIWSFGCLVYEIVTGTNLFKYQKNKKFDLTETENMLYQMLLYTEEDFRADQLRVSPRAPEYFRSDCALFLCCQMLKEPIIFNWSITEHLKDKNILSPEEIEQVANLVERCLRLNPETRETASELLKHPWFDGVD
ncbi:kinase-like protein [Clavulina sp. PMI_390]|nr:kinase-like protein [Clavulina sp. PMI_390]